MEVECRPAADYVHVRPLPSSADDPVVNDSLYILFGLAVLAEKSRGADPPEQPFQFEVAT